MIRREETRGNAILIVIIILVIIAVGILFLLRTGFDLSSEQQSLQQGKESTRVGGGAATAQQAAQESVQQAQGSQESTRVTSGGIREITIKAQRFSFAPGTIRVKQGERVKLSITNTDTTHGISLPDFNAEGRDSLEFTADKKGTFTFYCANYCGSGHSDMRGTLIVE